MTMDHLDFYKEMATLREWHSLGTTGSLSPAAEDLNGVNEGRFKGKNTLLMEAVLLGGKEDVSFLLGIKNLEVNARNADGDTAAEIAWKLKRYEYLLFLLQKDSLFPEGFLLGEVHADEPVREQLEQFVEGRQDLHRWIIEDDLRSIQKFTENHRSSVYYGVDNVSALSRAIEYERKEICAHFASTRAEFRIPKSLTNKVRWPQVWENSHISKLVNVTKFSEKQDREEEEAVVNMYLELNKHAEISSLMKVIQNENFEIFFVIKSECVNPEETNKAFGITKSDGRIFIAARGITTKDGYKLVYGVFAHEICHLVMCLMYGEDGTPYYSGDRARKESFSKICKLFYDKRNSMNTIIREVYELYEESDWECELIVRIPHVRAVYIEDETAKIFVGPMSILHKYYVDYILPDCREFSNPKFYSTPLRKIKELSAKRGIICGSDTSISPFVRLEKYEKYLIRFKKFSLLPTSNPKLGALHIFHDFKQRLPLHAEKRCLAFDLECYFESDNDFTIFEAFNSDTCKKLIFLAPDKKSNLGKAPKIDEIHPQSVKDKEVILVASADYCKEHPEWKVEKILNYHWDDLTEKFQEELLNKKILYQGKITLLRDVLTNVNMSEVITPELLMQIMSTNDICIGENLRRNSFEYKTDFYIERKFTRYEYKKDSLWKEELPPHYLFVTGLLDNEFKNLIPKEELLQMIDLRDNIQDGKYIFLPKVKDVDEGFFDQFFGKNAKTGKPTGVYWIHHEKGSLLLRKSLGRGNGIEKHFQELLLDEQCFLREMRESRVVLVTDDPGSGKSTALGSLMKKMKVSYPENFICSVNLPDLLMDSSDPLSLHHVQDSCSTKGVLEYIQQICRLNNQLEKKVFESFLGVAGRIVIFFDGYDEISSNLRTNVMKVLQTLMNFTKAHIWIFTRNYDRLALEVEMDAVSFSLKKFTLEDQTNYLNDFWKRELVSLDLTKENLVLRFKEMVQNLEHYPKECGKLSHFMKQVLQFIEEKNQTGFREKINGLDFSDYSKTFIRRIKHTIPETNIVHPLCLWMMACIVLNSNLKIPKEYDKFSFYADFMERKVNRFLRVKCRIANEGKYQDVSFNLRKKHIFKSLWKFSDRVIRSEFHKEQRMENYDLEQLVDIGVLRKEGKDYHFFHKTFAEFFLSQMVVKRLEAGKLSSEDSELISDILLKESYREIRVFLDSFFENNESQSLYFSKILIQKLHLRETYARFCKTQQRDLWLEKDKAGYRVWRKLFQDCENQSEFEDDDLILNMFNNADECYFPGLMEFFNSTLSDLMLFKLFESLEKKTYELLFKPIRYLHDDELSAMLNIFKKILKLKKSSLKYSATSTDKFHQNRIASLKIFETKYDDRSIFLEASESSNLTAFFELLEFSSSFMSREAISECLQRTAFGCESVLHLRIKIKKGKVLNDLRKMQRIIGKRELSRLLLIRDNHGRTMLQCLALYHITSEYFAAILEFIKEVMEGESFTKYLLQQDNLGKYILSYTKSDIMETAMEFLSRHLHKEKMKQILFESKKDLEIFIRWKNGKLTEMKLLDEVFSRTGFCKIITAKNNVGCTRLHTIFLLLNYYEANLVISDVRFYIRMLDRNSLMDFLLTQDALKNSFLHYWAKCNEKTREINILHEVQSVLSPVSYEKLISMMNSEGQTFIFSFNGPLSELKFLDKVLGRDKFRNLVTAKSGIGWTRLHYLCCHRYDKVLMEDLHFFAEILNKPLLLHFISTIDRKGNTFFHTRVKSMSHTDKADIFRELLLRLQRDMYEKLINIQNNDGETFIFDYKGSLSELRFLDKIVGRDQFKNLVTAKRNDGFTRLHYISANYLSEDVFLNDFQLYLELLDKPSLSAFILTKDEYGNTFFHHLSKSTRQEFKRKTGNAKILCELHFILSRNLYIELIDAVNNLGETFMLRYNGPLSEITLMENIMGTEKFIKQLTTVNREGSSRLHMMRNLSTLEIENVFLSDFRLYLSRLNAFSLKKLILAKDKDGNSFLHLIPLIGKEVNKKLLVNEIQKQLTSQLYGELLSIENNDGELFKINDLGGLM